MGQIQTIDDLIGFLLRRWRLILAVALIGAMASAIFGKMQPDIYETAAVIEVQAAQVDGTAAQDGSARLMQSIEHRLTTRDAMIGVIDRHGLFAGLPLTVDEKVAALRASVRFQPIASVGNQTFGAPSSLSAILISVRLDTAEGAARVANDFAQGIVDLSATGTADKARDTYAFFQAEVTRIEAEMARLEADTAAFRNANAGALPALVAAQQDELVALEEGLRTLDAEGGALRAEQAQLAGRDSLRATERRRLDEIMTALDLLAARRAALAERRDAISAAIAGTPEVERQLAGFDRQRQQLQDQFDVVTRRLAEADTAVKLAERQQGERFALLERAVTPLYPVGSGGRKIALAGAVASIGLAFALAFVLDLMRPVVRTSAQMERQLGLRPVVAIPDLDLPDRRGGAGRGTLSLLPDLRRHVLALPRFVVVAGGLTVLLMAAATMV